MSVPSFPSASAAAHAEGFIHSKDHLRLYWQSYTPPSPIATVGIVHGGGDHGGRYPALTSALVEAGFAVWLFDYRGHGQSDGRRWYVHAFREYLDDLDAFATKIRAKAPPGRLFIAAHSHGALIAALWGMAPGREAAGFVLSSPYMRLAVRPPALKVLAARAVGTVVPWLPISTGLPSVDLTSDEEMQRWTDRDPLYGRTTTPRWFTESRRAQQEALRRAAEFRHPLLVLAAGADRIADPVAARAFVEGAGSSDKEFRLYEGFRHEIYNEVGRDRPIADAVAWLRTRATATAGPDH